MLHGLCHYSSVGYQSKDAWCGPAALQSALQIHGVRVGQGRLAKILDTAQDGTDELDLLNGLDRLGAQHHELSTDRRADARAWLLRFAPVAPILLCVDSFDHWVVVAGMCGPRLWLLDSSSEAWNRAGLGRWALLPKTILKRWRAARRVAGGSGRYYGIALLSCDAMRARKCTAAARDD